MAEGAGVKDIEGFTEEWVMLLEGAISYRQITDNNDAAQIARRTAEARINDYLEAAAQSAES